MDSCKSAKHYTSSLPPLPKTKPQKKGEKIKTTSRLVNPAIVTTQSPHLHLHYSPEMSSDERQTALKFMWLWLRFVWVGLGFFDSEKTFFSGPVFSPWSFLYGSAANPSEILPEQHKRPDTYFTNAMEAIDRSSRLRPRCTCEQEQVRLSNAFLHNYVARAKIRARMSDLSVGPSLRWDWSIRNGSELNGSVYCPQAHKTIISHCLGELI